MAGRKRIDLDVPGIVAAYEGGEVPSSIADRLGVTAQTVRNRLYEAGVTIRPGGPPPVDLPTDKIAAEYGRGDPLSVLGRRYGVCPETIRRRLLRHGVTLRSPDEGLALRMGQHGDLAALAAAVGVPERRMKALLLAHGFIY